MAVTEYLGAIKQRLTTDPIVSGYFVVRERVTLVDGYLRVRLTVSDGSQLEFSEYVQRSPDDQIGVVTYSYHWADADGDLIKRWDNTPHFPNLPGFPHHVHDGHTRSVAPGEPISIFGVLDEIARLLGS